MSRYVVSCSILIELFSNASTASRASCICLVSPTTNHFPLFRSTNFLIGSV